MGVDVAGADRLLVDPQGLDHPAAADRLPGAHRGDAGGRRGDATPTGSAASTRTRRTSSARWRSTPRRSSPLPRVRAARGAEEGLARRPHRRHRRPRTAERFGWKVGDRSRSRRTICRKAGRHRALGVQRRRHLRREARRATDDLELLLPLRLPERGDAAAGRHRRLVHRPHRRPGAGRRGRRRASTRSSPTRRPRPRPRPRRRSRSRSPTRSATSARSSPAIAGGGLLHHPAGRRQHHGAVGARAHQRAGGAQDPGLHRRPGAGAGARRVAAARAARRRRSGCCSPGWSSPRSAIPTRRRPAGLLPAGAGRRARRRRWRCCSGSSTGAPAGDPGHAPAHRRRAAEGLTMLDWLSQVVAVTGLNLRTLGAAPRRLAAPRSSASPAWWRCSSPCSRSPRASARRMTAAGSPDTAIVLRSRQRQRDDERPRRATTTRIIAEAPGRAARRGRAGRLGRALRHRRPAEALDRHRRQRAAARRRSRRAFEVRDEVRDRRGPPLRAGPQRGHRRPRRGRASSPGSTSATDAALGRERVDRWSASSRPTARSPSRRSGATPACSSPPTGAATRFQSVYAKLESPEAFDAFKDALTTDPRLDVKVDARDRVLRRAVARC